MTDSTALEGWIEGVSEARELTDATRELIEAVVRARPGESTASVAAELRALSRRLDAQQVEDLLPWPYVLPWPQRKELLSAVEGEGEADQGNSWTYFNPVAPPIRMRVEDGRASGSVSMGAVYTGPPQRVHGGFVATLIDHALGILLHAADRPSFTARLEVDYLGATPIGGDLEVSSWIEQIDGRKTKVRASIHADGLERVRGYGLFVTVAP